jgi:hypothetical protein
MAIGGCGNYGAGGDSVCGARVDEYEIIADGVTTGAGQRGLPQGGTAGTA